MNILNWPGSHPFVCSTHWSHLHSLHADTHVLTLMHVYFSRMTSGWWGSKGTCGPKGCSQDKLQDPTHSWIVARASTGLNWKGILPGRMCILLWCAISHPSLSDIWDCGRWLRANRGHWDLAVDALCTLAASLIWLAGLQLLWALAAEVSAALSQRSTLGTMTTL